MESCGDFHNKVYEDKLRDVACKNRTTPEAFESLIQRVRDLGAFCMRFSRVNREGTLESDTDHTVMLAVVACAVAAKCQPGLDIGKVAQYALVHDLVEAYCGDTPTFDLERVDVEAKKKREEEALIRIKSEFRLFPWLGETIERYEKPDDPEARFVKTLDKAMPAVIHNLNDGLFFEKKEPNTLQDEVRTHGQGLREKSYTHDQELCLSIREVLMERVIARQWDKYGRGGTEGGMGAGQQPAQPDPE